MNVISIADVSCGAFGQAPEDLDPSVLHRFVVGEDPGPTPVDPAGLAELGDPFATLLLQKGVFPLNADQLLAAIDAATPANDPLRTEMTFLLGEGSQLPGTGEEGPDRGLRFIVSRGRAPEGIDLLLSAADPAGGLVELMAWDRKAGGFNYYRTVGRGPAWALAGNSRHALTEPTRGKGPFESHPSGSLIMKELKFPWLHWSSSKAQIPANAFPEGDPRVEHRWFKEKLLNADVMEQSVAIPSITRWTEARFTQLATGDGGFADPRRVLEQIVTSPTANLVTSPSGSAAVKAGDRLVLPPTFFVDSDALSGKLGLAAPPDFEVSGADYLASLEELAFALTKGGFRHPADPKRFADTHFAFAVPERAFEDQATLQAALDAGLVSPRLAASLLMVDFPNPVFSSRRTALLEHAPDAAPTAAGFSQEMADRILATADAAGEGSPEREFADRWSVGEDFAVPFNALLTAYCKAVVDRLATREGFFDYVRLAESRRDSVRALPIGQEFELLFARPSPDAASGPLRMTELGTVEEDN